MTWQQQQMMTTASLPEKKKSGKKPAGGGGASKKGASSVAIPSPAKESLTWQQELLGSGKARKGPTFDVFADSRDEATFGSASDTQSNGTGGHSKDSKRKKQVANNGAAGRRKRAGSVGEVTNRSSNSKGNSSAPSTAHGQQQPNALPLLPPIHMSGSRSGPVGGAAQPQTMPSTPNGKFAYAGPNFHNSPSPASLPVPKFLQPKGAGSSSGGGDLMAKSPSSLFAREAMAKRAVANGSGGSNDDETSTSSDEWEEDPKRRNARGATAPPELQSGGDAKTNGTQDRRSATIESLLARMMRPGSD